MRLGEEKRTIQVEPEPVEAPAEPIHTEPPVQQPVPVPAQPQRSE
jgi:hypothetical protein